MATTENKLPWQNAMVSSWDARCWSIELLPQPLYALVEQVVMAEPAVAAVVLRMAIGARSHALKQGLGLALSQEVLETVVRCGMVSTLMMERGCRGRLEEVTGACEDECS